MDDTDTTNMLLMSRQKDPAEEVMRVFREEMREYEEAQLRRMEEEEAQRTGVDVSVIRRNRLQREAEKEGAYDTDLEDHEDDEHDLGATNDGSTRDGQKKTQLQRLYANACLKYKTVSSSQFRDQVMSPVVKIANLGLTVRDFKPIAITLTQNTQITTLDLSDNSLGSHGLQLLFNVLIARKSIIDLNLSNNRFGAAGADAIEMNLEAFAKIRKLNLSGNDFVERNASMVCGILQKCINLRTLFISGNNFDGQGSKIASVLGPNRTLENLRFSWNNIRGKSAIDLAKCLKENGNLVQLDLSWNGLGDEGARVLAESLAVNDSLVSIDLSYNRIGVSGSLQLAKGLLKNETLEELILVGNMLGSPGADMVIEAIKVNPNRKIRKLEVKSSNVTYAAGSKWEEDPDPPLIRCDSFIRVHDSTCKMDPINSLTTTDTFSLVNFYLTVNRVNLITRTKSFFDSIGETMAEELEPQQLKRILNRIPIPVEEEKINQMVDHLPTNENSKFPVTELASLFPKKKNNFEVQYAPRG